jgi:hypothetical protein
MPREGQIFSAAGCDSMPTTGQAVGADWRGNAWAKVSERSPKKDMVLKPGAVKSSISCQSLRDEVQREQNSAEQNSTTRSGRVRRPQERKNRQRKSLARRPDLLMSQLSAYYRSIGPQNIRRLVPFCF